MCLAVCSITVLFLLTGDRLRAGVVICSVSELSFNMIGLLSAIFSTMTFAVQNVYSKKVMNSGVNHISVLLAVSQASLVLLIPFWLYLEGYSLLVGPLLDDIGSEKVTATRPMSQCRLLYCSVTVPQQDIIAAHPTYPSLQHCALVAPGALRCRSGDACSTCLVPRLRAQCRRWQPSRSCQG